MATAREYVEETVDELKNKVSWPTWSELQSSAIVVLIATLIIALMIFLMDVTFSRVMQFLYQDILG